MPSAVVVACAVAAAAGVVAGGAAYASLYPTSQIFGQVLIAGRDPHQLALTYDDGPNPAATPQLLEALSLRGVKASFFLIGDFARQQPALARAIAAEGHLVGNHTMTHPSLAWQSAARIRQELSDAKNCLEDVLGIAIRFFRPPFGSRRPYVIQAARELGMETTLWNVAGYDWTSIGADAIAAKLEHGVTLNQKNRRGSNLLLHDGSHRGLGADRQATVSATDRILQHHRSDEFVTIDAFRTS